MYVPERPTEHGADQPTLRLLYASMSAAKADQLRYITDPHPAFPSAMRTHVHTMQSWVRERLKQLFCVIVGAERALSGVTIIYGF